MLAQASNGSPRGENPRPRVPSFVLTIFAWSAEILFFVGVIWAVFLIAQYDPFAKVDLYHLILIGGSALVLSEVRRFWAR